MSNIPSPWGIPQELRAELLKEDSSTYHHLARSLDALQFLNYQSKDLITENEMIDQLKPFRIDKKTIRKVLQCKLPNEDDQKPVFQSVTRKNIIQQENGSVIFTLDFRHIKLSKQDIEKYWKNRGKKRGRPPKLYLMPHIHDLWSCYFQDDNQTYFSLRHDDLKSISQYRQAIQREKIRAEPGKHSRQEFANETGVTTRTTYNYDKRLGTKITPNYREEEVTESTIDWYIDKLPHGYLKCIVDKTKSAIAIDETATYPPTREQFNRLKGHGITILFRWRSINEYELPESYEKARYVRRDKIKYEVRDSDRAK